MKNKFVSIPEAAQLKGVSEGTIRLWCNKHYLKGAYKSGKFWIIPINALDSQIPSPVGKRAENYGKKD